MAKKIKRDHEYAYDKRLLKTLVTTYYNVQEQCLGYKQRQLAKARAAAPPLHNEDNLAFESINEGFKEVMKMCEKEIKKVLKRFPIWNDHLKQVTGVGHMIGAVCVAKFDPLDAPAPEGYGLEHEGAYEGEYTFYERQEDGEINIETRDCIMRQRTTSQFWSYAGLGVIEVSDGAGGTKMVGARPVKGKKINYDPWLRAKLLGVLAPSFIKCNAPYRVFYDERKKFREEKEWGASKMHRHKDAMRHMIKCFLMDLFYVWRHQLDLKTRKPYAIEKLGLTPSQAWHVEEHPGFTKVKESAALTA